MTPSGATPSNAITTDIIVREAYKNSSRFRLLKKFFLAGTWIERAAVAVGTLGLGLGIFAPAGYIPSWSGLRFALFII